MRIEPGTVEGMEHFFLHKIDNFLPDTYFNYLSERLASVPKYKFSHNTSYEGGAAPVFDANVFDVGQFVYTILTGGCVVDEVMFSLMEPLFFQLYDTLPEYSLSGIARLKCNLLVCRPDAPVGAYNTPHSDVGMDTKVAYSMLMYMNDADGDTIIFKERYEHGATPPTSFTEAFRITPKANTVLFFNSMYYHASSNPRVANTRFAVNAIFAPKA